MIHKEKKSELTMLKIIMYKVYLLTAIIPQSFSFSFSLFKLLNLKIKIFLFFCYNPTEPQSCLWRQWTLTKMINFPNTLVSNSLHSSGQWNIRSLLNGNSERSILRKFVMKGLKTCFFFSLNEMLESSSSFKANFRLIKQWVEKR